MLGQFARPLPAEWAMPPPLPTLLCLVGIFQLHSRLAQSFLVTPEPAAPAILQRYDSLFDHRFSILFEVTAIIKDGFRISEILDLNGWFLIN
jgi:hypothetical protein